MTRELLLRYAAFQVPGWGLVGGGAWLAWEHFGMDGGLAVGILAAWIAKDVLMFPFVRVAYAPRDERGPGGLRGVRAVVVDALAPNGRVRIGDELWRARLRDPASSLEAGHAVRVQEVEGLTLVVAPETEG